VPPVKRIHNQSRSNSRVLRSLLLGAAAIVGLLQAPACGGKDDYSVDENPPPPTGSVEVTVTYPTDRDSTATAAVHVWVLAGTPDAGATCAKLVGGEISPDDLEVIQRADSVTTDPAVPITSEGVLTGNAYVYVETVDYRGDVQLAGCTDVTVAMDTTAPVTVELETARVYDCADSATEDGAPCDDGRFCTTGETCQRGQCQGGEARTCDHLTVGCTQGVCTEPDGCTTEAMNEGDTCDTGLYCTIYGTCRGGDCVGEPRNCALQAGPCEVDAGCDETNDACLFGLLPETTACDDQDACTTGEACNALGACVPAALVDCTTLDDACNVGTCDPSNGSCAAAPRPIYTACTDNDLCTTGDYCDGAGACAGTPVDCSYLDGQCAVGICRPATGLCEADPTSFPANTSCSDNNACTTGDVCNGAGTCVSGTPVVCGVGAQSCDVVGGLCNTVTGCPKRPSGNLCGDGTDCTHTCDGLGTCLTIAASSTTPCSDLDACTTGDLCNGSGTCVPGTPVVCGVGAGQTCKQVGGVCNAITGCPNRASGTLCGDASDCSQTCDGLGACQAVAAAITAACDDLNECTSGNNCDGLGTCGTPLTGTVCTPPPLGTGICNAGVCE
jgi:hypothetical protein